MIKRVLLFSVLAFILFLINAPCEFPWERFKRNPNLRLIKSERIRPGYTSSLPVFTPDGSHIYYLRKGGDIISTRPWGTLWKMKADGTDANEIFSDTFCAMDISLDGQKLVLATSTEETGGKLVILDLSGLTLDTILASNSDIFDVVFSKTDSQKIYFCSKNNGIYRINIDGSGEELINQSIKNYFDLTISDSIVTQPPWYYHPKPKVHNSRSYIAYIKPVDVPGSPYADTDDIILVNTETMDTIYLNANPYKFSWIYFPCWSPEGNKLLFTACELGPGRFLRPREGEIWLLEKVFDK